MTEDVSVEIMEGTYRALCEHGYAGLTMQDIADETDKSKAALHYHYDSKRELLGAFLEYLFEQFTARVGDPDGDTADERLRGFVDDVLAPPIDDADERVAFQTAVLELKAQAPYDDGIREHMIAFDEYLHDQVRRLVAEGVASGTFRADVDPADTARFIVTALDGAQTKQVAVGQDVECTRRMLHAYVESRLVADDGDRRNPEGPSE